MIPTNTDRARVDRPAAAPTATDGLRLNLGCGLVAPEGWVNCDGSWNAQLSRIRPLHELVSRLPILSGSRWPTNVEYLNLNRRWRFADRSASVVYASHAFEHLSTRSAHLFLSESARVLRPGGTLRIVIPDLLAHARAYVQSFDSDPKAREQFLWALNMQIPEGRNLVKIAYDFITGHPSLHKTMYDPPALSKMIVEAGFSDVLVQDRNVSRGIPDIDVLEAGPGYDHSLYVEALRA
ncbi:MAG: methyltransferase domain-containing protein [Deltaproteobacteria bacterium]|nr:methyltransferase domain-containing protein [Deltaproteobacteria bacterium]